MMFVQQECSICHSELTRFGNITVKDGIICRNCRKLCSPFLTNEQLAEKTVNEIKEHLRYREENQAALNEKKLSLLTEGYYNLFADEQREYFCLTKKNSIGKENCDLFRFDSVRGVRITRGYYKKNPEKVDVNLIIELDNQQIPEVKIRINEFPNIDLNGTDYVKALALAASYRRSLLALDK